jgi:hypothetical protein
MAKRCPKVILEGTRLTHKTDLAFALNSHPRIVGPRRYPYPSPLVSAEWCGFSNHPWGEGLVNYRPEDEARAMETYATWARLFELLPYYSWIVDRFHLSTRTEQRRATARAQRLLVSGKPDQYGDLGAFLAEQALFRELAAGSALPVLELDVSDEDVAGAAERVADWLEATGGSSAPTASSRRGIAEPRPGPQSRSSWSQKPGSRKPSRS